MNRKRFFIFSIIYLLIGVGSGFVGWRSGDCEWIRETAGHIFDLEPYSHNYLINIAPPNGIGYGYPPLLLFVISPFITIGDFFGWTSQFITRNYNILLFLVDIANIYLIVSFIKANKPKILEKDLQSISVILFFSGFFLYTSGFSCHPETLVIFCSFLGLHFLRKENFIMSGMLFGLAFSSKQVAVFIIIPVLFYLLFNQKSKLAILKFLLSILLTILFLILPFLVHDFHTTIYGIFGYTSDLIIRGPNFWWFILTLQKILHFQVISIEMLRANANFVLLGMTCISSFILLFRRKTEISESYFYGVILLSLFTYSVFAKWLSFHQFLIVFVYFIIWDTLRNKGNFPAIGVAYAFILFAANFTNSAIWQLEIFLINLIFYIYIVRSLLREKNS